MIEISGAIGAISATVTTLKTALAARDEAKIDAAMSDLKDRLFDLQTANLELVEGLHTAQSEIHTLVEEVKELKAKLRERGLYTLHNLAKGTDHFWAYRYQGDDGTSDGTSATPHYLCQPCFDSGRKIVLRHFVTELGPYYLCTGCKTEAHL